MTPIARVRGADPPRREDFNGPWLVLLAALGFATALSGATLWVLRAARRVRR